MIYKTKGVKKVDITLCARVCDFNECLRCKRNPSKHKSDDYQSWMNPEIVKNKKTGKSECNSFVFV